MTAGARDGRAASPPPASAPSAADVEARARSLQARRAALYDDGSYAPALSELQRAAELAPTYKLAYNIALVQMRLGDFAGALQSLRQYVRDGGAEVPPARRTEVEGYLVDLPHRIARAEVTANASEVEISVDDRPLGKTPLPAPLELNPGPHRVKAEKPGFGAATKEVELAAGELAAVSFALTAVPPPEPAAVALEPQPWPPGAPAPPTAAAPSRDVASTPAPETRPPPLWIGWSVTGALALGAVGTGIGALVESHTVTSDVNDHPTSAGALHSAHQATVGLALASDILTASALIAGLTTAYVLVSSRRSGVARRVELRAGPGSVQLAGTF